jgi:hypothetical protein
METPAELGRRMVCEMREPSSEARDDAAFLVLRFGADDFSDDDVWDAAMAALDEASTDSELWRLGDGFIDESVRFRPALNARWRALRGRNTKVDEVYRVMNDPTMNMHEGPWG